MNDIINLNSIKSGGCDCNKPKKQPCGCGHKEPCYSAPSGDLYFKVKNLFSELKSEWQRAEARTNLGVTDIIKLDLIKYGKGSGDSNVWQMVVAKGGSQRVYDFVVNNGDSGESATIEIGDVYTTDETPIVRNVGSESHAILNFGIPRGKTGAKGDKGLSAYDIYVKNGGLLDEAAWLKSLKGEPGKPGDPGKDGIEGDLIKSISIVDYSQYTKEFLDDKKITANMFIWRVALKDGRSFDFWIPEGTGGGGGVVPVGKPTFLYKLVKFNSKPTSAELTSKLAELQNEVNKDNSGRTVEYLTENKGWRRTSFVLSEPGYEFIYLATSVITEDNIEPWVVTQLTGAQGEEGPEGPQGPSGTGGSDGQGLIGPVIRMRGTWLEDAVPCYKNQSNLAQSGTELRFIDVVFDNDNYWMVSPNHVGCTTERPGQESTLWVKATEFDFAYIKTIIADYLKAYTIDANEIRIHKVNNWNKPTSDQIVAGMTSGKPVNTWETVPEEYNDITGDPIRIWAGTKVDILKNNGENKSYTLNLEDAKFKVRQSGKLEASDADIEGTILANILRLGEHGKLDENNVKKEGSFLAPESTTSFILPKLQDGKVLLFYLLTNRTGGSNINVYTSDGDYIKEADAEQATTSFTAKYEKLYLLFGIDTTWYVIEQNMKAELDTQEIDVRLTTASRTDCYYCFNRSINNGSAIQGKYSPTWNVETPTFTIMNSEQNPTLFAFPSSKTYYLYGTYDKKVNDDNTKTSYIKCIGKIEFNFSQCNSIVLEANDASYSEIVGQVASDKYTYTLTDADTLQNKSFTVKISTNTLPQNIDSELRMIVSEDDRYDDAFEHQIDQPEPMGLVTECISNLSISEITYSKVAISDINRLIKFTNAGN